MSEREFFCQYNFENPDGTLKIVNQLNGSCPHIAKVNLEKLYLSVSVIFDKPCLISALPECDKPENTGFVRIIASSLNSPDLYTRIVEVTLQSSDKDAISFPNNKGPEPSAEYSKQITVRPKFCGNENASTPAQISTKVYSETDGPLSRTSVAVRCSGFREGIIRKKIKGQDSLNAVSGTLATDKREPASVMKRIFFSYAWNPETNTFLKDSKRDESLETPVKVVYEILSQHKELDLLYDKTNMKPGDYLTRFLEHPTRGEVDLMIVFSSAKYWRSWYCMAEFCAMMERFQKTSQNERSSIIIVEHSSGIIRKFDDLEQICKYWDDPQRDREFPTCFNDQCISSKKMREKFKSFLDQNAARICSDLQGATHQWSKANSEELENWIKETVIQKLGIDHI
ncbi:hypothetical protein [Gimesia sp.]|uniref:hypothetical protein n=1 Tax=Gimesia sp. TaxID=2024833 RepID=UPI003A8E2AA9